jgi:hypothetical protein
MFFSITVYLQFRVSGDSVLSDMDLPDTVYLEEYDNKPYKLTAGMQLPALYWSMVIAFAEHELSLDAYVLSVCVVVEG